MANKTEWREAYRQARFGKYVGGCYKLYKAARRIHVSHQYPIMGNNGLYRYFVTHGVPKGAKFENRDLVVHGRLTPIFNY